MINIQSWALSPVLLSVFLTIQTSHAEPGEFAEAQNDEDSGIIIDGTGKSAIGLFQGAAQSDSNPEFIRFNAQYGNRWQSSLRPNDGKVTLLYGATSNAYANGPENAAQSFLKDTHDLFGIKSDLSDLRSVRVDKTELRDHVRFQQTFKGVPVSGSEVLVHINKQGQVTMVQNGSVADLNVINNDVIAEDTALKTARDHITRTVSGGVTLNESKSEKIIAPFPDGYKFIWKISTPTRNPFAYWVYHIDAETGAIVYHADEITHLKSGKGRAYKTNANWQLNKISNVPLKQIFTPAEGNPGYLLGLRSYIFDDSGNDPFSSNFDFRYDPVTQKDLFDSSHTYYQMSTIWDWWDKKIIKKFSLSTPAYFYDIPTLTLVNIDGLCNAFYSPELFTDGTNDLPGFAFGDENSCETTGSEDLSNDVDVIRHEFAHAIMDWSGFDSQFGGAVHGYGRSMGEGNADYYAFLYTPKDPFIGDVAFAWTPEGYLRNLDSTRAYPRDVDFPAWGTPEEHYTGEIWGGYLYDLYKALKAKSIPYVYQSSYYFTAAGGHRNGFPDFFDGIRAQMAAEQDLTGKLTSTAKAWGSWASRGINGYFRAPYSHATDYFYTGAPGSDSKAALITFNFPPTKSVKTKGNLLLTGDEHEYVVNVTENLAKLSAKVTSVKSGGIVAPQVNLYNSSHTLVASGVTSSNNASVTYENVAPGVYVFVVTGNAGAPARGNYNFAVTSKK